MSIFYIKFTVLITIQEVNEQSYDQPDAKTNPVGYAQLTHHVQTAK